jgi:hypothetical protein
MKAALLPDKDEMLRALAVLTGPTDVVELRVLGFRVNGRFTQTKSGYFNDHDQLTSGAVRANLDASGIYIIPNTTDPKLLARAANTLRFVNKEPLTGDGDILHRRWFLVDVDPVRPSGISSTEEEHRLALETAHRIKDQLLARGWPAPIIADSGNGVHILFAIDLPNDEASRDLIKQVLRALAAEFDTDCVKIDTATFNAARLVRLYGSVVKKGFDTAERPHRLSRIVEVPERLVPIAPNLLQSAAADARGEESKPRPRKGSPHPKRATEDGDQIPQGERHRTLVAVAGSMLWRRLTADEIEAALLTMNRNRCQPPLDDEKVRGLVADLVKRWGGSSAEVADELAGEEAIAPLPETPVEPFPLEVLPGPLRQFVEEAATSLNCPPDYVAVPVLAVLGTAIGNQRRLSVKEGWTESACLYTAVVGDPGTAKSPALQIAADPVRALQEQFLEEYRGAKRAQQQVRKAKSEGGSEEPPEIEEPDDPPVLRQIMTTDTTIGALMSVLDRNALGIALVRDELTAWVLSMNEYKTRKAPGPTAHTGSRAGAAPLW